MIQVRAKPRGPQKTFRVRALRDFVFLRGETSYGCGGASFRMELAHSGPVWSRSGADVHEALCGLKPGICLVDDLDLYEVVP